MLKDISLPLTISRNPVLHMELHRFCTEDEEGSDLCNQNLEFIEFTWTHRPYQKKVLDTYWSLSSIRFEYNSANAHIFPLFINGINAGSLPVDRRFWLVGDHLVVVKAMREL